MPNVPLILYVLGSNSIFILFFSDRRTLKFLKGKCNPTNKKSLALPTLLICVYLVWFTQAFINFYDLRGYDTIKLES